MQTRPLVVVGAGPAGTAAAINAAKDGINVTIIDENPVPAAMAQLNVPLFFGQRFDDSLNDRTEMTDRFIASNQALTEAKELGVEILLGTCVWGAFRNSENSRNLDEPQIGVANHERSWIIKFQKLIVATGARDLAIGFAGCDLAGVMGANAAHSLITRYQTMSAQRIVILGNGNLGLNTAKLAIQNGIHVPAIVDIAPTVRGDESLVKHLKEQGVKFLTSHVIKQAAGANGNVEAAVLVQIDENLQPVAGTEKSITADTICLAIGLVPNIEILSLLSCQLTFNPQLGGFIPILNDHNQTTIENVFATGDAAGIGSSPSTHLPPLLSETGRERAKPTHMPLSPPERGASERSQPTVPFRGAKGDASERSKIAGVCTRQTDNPVTYRKQWLTAISNASEHDIIVCQCENVTRSEIINLQPPRYLNWSSQQMNRRNLNTQLNDNPANPNQVKRLTRAGTGICQGRNCREQVALILAEESKTDIDNVPLSTYRPPLRPIPLNVLWNDDEPQETRDQWPKWFAPNHKVLG